MELIDLSFAYGRQLIFDQVSFAFPPGRTVLLGRNGVGKTTLLNLLTGSLRPTKGAAVASFGSRRQRLRQIGFMPQVVTPVPGLSVIDQVA